MVTINAKITRTMFGIEDHGILTFYLHLEGDGWGQGYGGYSLDGYDESTKERSIGYGGGLIAMKKIMEVVGVRTWEDLPGKYVRIQRQNEHAHEIVRLGHVVQDRWVSLREEFSKLST